MIASLLHQRKRKKKHVGLGFSWLESHITTSRRQQSPAMDPVSLTLGILPLVGNAINVYKSVRSKFKIFCHYSAEVERIRKLFGAQRVYFLNEVELVLRLVSQDQILIKEMMKDPAHSQWRAHGLERKLEAILGRNLPLLKDVVEDIGESTTTLQKAFKCFLPLEEEKERVRFLFGSIL